MSKSTDEPFRRVEVITSVQRRRRWSVTEKVRLVEEAMQPGMSVSYVPRYCAERFLFILKCSSPRMFPMRVAPSVVLTASERAALPRLTRSKLTSVRLLQRARIVLLAAKGLTNKDIARHLGVGRLQVARWRERYLAAGLGGIERDLPRGAPPQKIDVDQLIELTTQTTPENATRWSSRRLAAKDGHQRQQPCAAIGVPTA